MWSIAGRRAGISCSGFRVWGIGVWADKSLCQVGGNELSQTPSVWEFSVGEAEFSETVVESPIAFECGRGFAKLLQIWIRWI